MVYDHLSKWSLFTYYFGAQYYDLRVIMEDIDGGEGYYV
jgi:hypothetical protein